MKYHVTIKITCLDVIQLKKFIRFEIITKDRIGITVEILEKIYKQNINLISLEVFLEKVCIKIESINNKEKNILQKSLFEIKDVISIDNMELLYYEQNEKRLLAVIDSVDEGIIVTDKKFDINIFNNYCEDLFRCKKEDVIGTDIRQLINEDAPVVNLINKGIEYDNLKCNLKTKQGWINYITTGRAIKNDNNETIGSVASIKDLNKAIKLINIISNIKDGAFKDIIGNSSELEKVKKLVSTVARSNSTVMLRGASGTGKELFAKAIHTLSDRKNEKFVTINCAALPEGLLESELFGYEKGSFTGAMQNGKEGLFKEANCGTIFLDEVGELPMFLQAKLLRVLQEGTIRKIGSTKEEKIDVRIIAATNRNLEEMIINNHFREDLYYRLNVIPIYIPTLKERLDDIPILVNFFIERLNKKLNKVVKKADLPFINKLMEYEWPGNIRELQNIIERAMNLCEGDCLTTSVLLTDFRYNPSNVRTPLIKANPERELKLERQLKLKEIVEQCERSVILEVLKTNKSYRKTAKVLGVSHTTIMNKIKKYNL